MHACMHASELTTSIGSSWVCSCTQARKDTLASKGIEHTSVDRENKSFACELVHTSIKLKMSCTIPK